MAQFSLDDIKAAADAKYGSTDIDFGDKTLVLTNALRLPEEKREILLSIQDDLQAEGADQVALLRDALRAAATNDVVAEDFLAVVGDDLALLITVFDKYTSGTQAGEA